MTNMIVRLAALIFGMMLLSSHASAGSELVTYKNAEYGFSFSYPSSWARETPKSALGVVKVSSDHGYGNAACNMVVYRSSAFKNKSTHNAVATLSPSFLIGELKRGGIDDAIVVESGLTKVFNRDAFFAVLSYSIKTMGETIPVKTLQVITTKSDVVYTFSCGTADPATFSSTYPVFRAIIGSLFIDQ